MILVTGIAFLIGVAIGAIVVVSRIEPVSPL
jgi:hypothetical protein